MEDVRIRPSDGSILQAVRKHGEFAPGSGYVWKFARASWTPFRVSAAPDSVRQSCLLEIAGSVLFAFFFT
jgi:hypothetical protein